MAISFLDAFVGVYHGHETLFQPHTESKLPLIHVYCFSPKDADNEALIREEISTRIGHPIQRGGHEFEVRDVRLVAPNKVMFCASFRLPAEVAFRSPSAE